MDWIEALILGLVQGLTEYLPVSSSGHLAIGSYLFGIEGEENLRQIDGHGGQQTGEHEKNGGQDQSGNSAHEKNPFF